MRSGTTPFRTPPQSSAGMWLKLLFYAAAATMLFFSLYHWKLRSGFSDTPNYIVNMTRSGGFEIAHYRFVAVINQWLPVLVMKLNGSMQAIGIAYSFAYTLAPVIMMLVALHWLRQPATALAILLQFTLMNSLLFYYTCSELQMGLGLLLLYNGILDHYLLAPDIRRRGLIIWSVVLLPTIYFSHPMLTPVLACWFLFRLVNRRQSWKTVAWLTAGFLLCFVVKKLWFTSTYEAVKGLSWEVIRPFGLNYFLGGLSRSFYQYLRHDAFLVPLLVLVTIALLISQRNWRLLFTMALCGGGLYLLVIIAFEDMNGMHIYDHYHEHYFQPAIMFLLLAFTDALFRMKMDQHFVLPPIAAMLFISFAKIHNGSGWLTIRQNWELSGLKLMDELGLEKAVMARSWAPDGIWIGSFWNSSNETLFLSALEGPEHAKSLFMVWNIRNIAEQYYEKNAVMMDGYTYHIESLPARYFRLNDKPYVILEDIVPDSVLSRMRTP